MSDKSEYYVKGLMARARGDIAWLDDDIRVVLVHPTLYTPDILNHEFLSDIPLGARVGTSGPLTSKAIVSGIANGEPSAFFTCAPINCGVGVLAVGTPYNAAVAYKHTGNAATSYLLARIMSADRLPGELNGEDIIIVPGALGLIPL